MKLLASSILIINAWRLFHAKNFTTSHLGRPACFFRLCKTIKSLSCCLCLLLLFFCPHSFASNPDTLNTLCELLKKGDAMAAEQLMQAESIDINMKLHVKSGETDDYMTPLMIVVQREYTAFAESLLKRGADINAQNNAGYTALMYAVVQGFTHIVKLLVNHHADLNIKDNNIATALMYAIVGKRVEIAIFLIDNGADLSLQDSSGYTALTYAAAQGQAEIVKHLLKMKAAIDMQEPNGQTPLMIAAERHPDIAILLLEMGANPNITRSNGPTVLMYAILRKKIPLINALVAHGANLNVPDKFSGFTPLTMAAATGLTEIVYLFIKHKANINLQDNDNNTALMCAISGRHTEIANFLINEGADLNLKNDQGHTALMIAASSEQTEIVKNLIEKGASSDS